MGKTWQCIDQLIAGFGESQHKVKTADFAGFLITFTNKMIRGNTASPLRLNILAPGSYHKAEDSAYNLLVD
jgi:hypothetical protein